jgi:hypothetical protein
MRRVARKLRAEAEDADASTDPIVMRVAEVSTHRPGVPAFFVARQLDGCVGNAVGGSSGGEAETQSTKPSQRQIHLQWHLVNVPPAWRPPPRGGKGVAQHTSFRQQMSSGRPKGLNDAMQTLQVITTAHYKLFLDRVLHSLV